MVFREAEAALSLWARFKRWRHGRNNPPIESVSGRFIRLFENHDVQRNQIPRFFGHGLTVKDVQDDAALHSKLDEIMLDACCALFAVRREWLDGAEPQVFPCHDFYKHPQDIAGLIESLQASNPEGGLDGVLIAPEEEDGAALLILEEMIGAVGNKPIYRHHLCNDWLFDYWKSRADLTACVAIAWKLGVHVQGTSMPKLEIERMANGHLLFSMLDQETWKLRGRKWYPEDMALQPNDFLRGIDPEQNLFGIIAALSRWLDLEQQGYMDTGLKMSEPEDVRQLFEQELGKYLP